ncbi:MAG: FtsK/SpoIIIE domain-containing protein [Proteobacteria bacterium]|nr:FtsK/SpoIIIE domain-containing protein [Pseudomonadota bacterium]
MQADRIVGRVGAAILKARLADAAQGGDGTDSAARFRLDRLSPTQIAAVVREVCSDPEISGLVDVKIPETLVRGIDMPEGALIFGNAGLGRNAETDRVALLTANGDEPNIADTVAYVAPLGAREFKGRGEVWAEAAARVVGVTPVQEDMRVFRAAVIGLFAALDLSLRQAGDFCASVAEAIKSEGLPIRDAVGFSLPLVGLPRDTSLFVSDRTYGTAATPWRRAFEKLWSDRAPLLSKLRKNGQPIDPADLLERYDANEQAIAEGVRPAVRAFIDAPPGDDAPAKAFALLEWERDGVHLIFDRPKERQQGLAQQTLDFFEFDRPDVLDARWKEHLEGLKAREKRSEWNDADEEFFEQHRHFLDEIPALRARWEKVFFGKPVECVDFLEGFVTAAHRLIAPAGPPAGDRLLRVRVRRGRKDWRENFNHDVGAFFSVMYRGLRELLGERVDWKVDGQGTNPNDPLFDYPSFFAHEKEARPGKVKAVSSASKAATQIRFEVSLVERVGSEERQLRKTQLLWSARPDAVGLSLRDDVLRLLRKGGCACTDVPRRLVGAKGSLQSVSLLDVGTLEATFGRDAGSLVPPPDRLGNMAREIRAAIDEQRGKGRLDDAQRDEIRAAWDLFETEYAEALRDLTSVGLGADSTMRQADAYGGLLRLLLAYARGDVCRSQLLAPVLSIGVARLSGGTPALIVPPWHPERLKALAVRTRRCAGLVGHMLVGENVSFGDHRIFFREFADELEHPFYPEVALATQGGGLVLVSETATVNGYSLMEPPARGEGRAMTDVLPGPAAKEIRELLERYVGLQPHEADNLSVLLYDADAAALPMAAVKELAGMETEGNFQCNVSVRHRDPERLRGIYAELVARADSDPDAPVVSETSDNFISKLRVSVSPPGSNPPRTADGFKPFDVAFLHDVVARTATVEWIPVEWSADVPDLEHAPSRWSYRGVSGEDELKAATFLTCPRQTRSGRAWVDSVGAAVLQRDHVQGTILVPARRISLQDERLRSILDEAHGLAEWVATYDELLDKRQLRANDVKVVRYRRQHTNGRNVIVSSNSELRLLSVLVRRRLRELSLPLSEDEIAAVSDRLIDDALSVSGDIVLRAAKRGVSAGELVGLVLSRWLMEREFGVVCGGRPSLRAFFLLDDYAAWLAQQENRLADLLGLCVEEVDGAVRLHVAVVESKYVSAVGSAEARRSSKAQLVATLSTLDDALFGDPGRLDRDLWLSRLSDLLLDASVAPGQTGLLERARSAIRDGAIGVTMRGYSHVFVHSAEPGAQGPGSLREPVESRCASPAFQEVFDRPELRALVEALARGADPLPIRAAMGEGEPWKNDSARPLARRTSWTEMVGKLIPAPAEPSDVPGEGAVAEVPAGEAPAEVAPSPGQTPTPEAPAVAGQTPTASGGEVVGSAYGPALSALVESRTSSGTAAEGEREDWATSVTGKLRAALNGYGLQAQVLGTRLTPNGCLVRLAGSDRLRLEDVEARRMQLLTTHGIDLVTALPKPGEIVVTIAGEKRRAVSLWDVWKARKENRNAAGVNVSIVLGVQELNGSVLYLNLGGDFAGLSQHAPHSLVAGATGSGKSVLIQAMLLDIAATNPSTMAKLVLIDPKMGVDYAVLDTLPHLREPVVTEKGKAAEVLAALVEEMEQRYRAFASARVRDLASFNAKAAPADRLPMVFLVHDEFADWMLDPEYKAAVGAAVQRLGVKARAAGIHLIFAAQRPDKDVMPMQLRDNLGNRLILKVSSEATSKIVLDRAGAERLLGRGHLAARLDGESGLVFAQAPWLSDEDMALAVEAIVADDGPVAVG